MPAAAPSSSHWTHQWAGHLAATTPSLARLLHCSSISGSTCPTYPTALEALWTRFGGLEVGTGLSEGRRKVGRRAAAPAALHDWTSHLLTLQCDLCRDLSP